MTVLRFTFTCSCIFELVEDSLQPVNLCEKHSLKFTEDLLIGWDDSEEEED